MAFILSNERVAAGGVVAAFKRYYSYIESVKHFLPPSVYELASSDWYFAPFEHLPSSSIPESRRSPHDAWLESVIVQEVGTGDKRKTRTVEIVVRLHECHHDGYIELRYKDVKGYSLGLPTPPDGSPIGVSRHDSWRFDEFRALNDGLILHEIEWVKTTWRIECMDIAYTWNPLPV